MNKTMRAVVLNKITKSEEIVLSEFPIPQVKLGWVLVKIGAFGLNHSEQILRLNEIQADYIQKPIIPGIECAGEIVDPSDSGMRVGQKVISMMGGMGRSFNGSYAEYALLPAHHVFPVESNLDWADLAAIPETYFTAWGSLFECLQLKPRDTLLMMRFLIIDRAIDTVNSFFSFLKVLAVIAVIGIILFFVYAILTCIDDFHPSNGHDASDMNAKMQTILRAYGNRVGRGRLNSKSEAMKDYFPQGNAIITGEFSPDVGESGTARYLCLDLKQGDVNNDELTKFQRLAADGVFSSVMFHYTEWLKETFLKDENGFVKMLSEMFRENRNHIRKRTEKENNPLRDRLIDDLVTLSFGFGFFVEFLKARNAILPETAIKMNTEFETVILSLARNQQRKTVEDQPTHVFLKKFLSLLDSDRITLIPKERIEILSREHCVGYEDEEYFYLDSSLVHKEVRRLCVDQGEGFAITERGLLSALAAENLLVKDNSGHNKKLIRIGNKTLRLLVVPKEIARRIAEEESI